MQVAGSFRSNRPIAVCQVKQVPVALGARSPNYPTPRRSCNAWLPALRSSVDSDYLPSDRSAHDDDDDDDSDDDSDDSLACFVTTKAFIYGRPPSTPTTALVDSLTRHRRLRLIRLAGALFAAVPGPSPSCSWYIMA